MDVGGYPNRLTLLGEYFFNAAGDTRSRIAYPDSLQLSDLPGMPPGVQGELAAADLMRYLLEVGLYEPNRFSQQYAALFMNLGRFLIPDLNLIANAIANLNQGAAQLTLGLSYADLNDFSLSFYLNGFVGQGATEYTLSGSALQAQVLAEVAF